MKQNKEKVKLPDLPLPRGPVKFTKCSEVFWRVYGKTGFVFRKGEAVCELIAGKLKPLTPANLVGRADQFFDPFALQWKKGKPKGAWVTKLCRMTQIEASTLLGMPETHVCVPEIKLVTRMPVLYEHGGKLREAAEGYNPECRVFVGQGFKKHFRISVQEARDALLDLLSEFGFATGADKARAYICLIAPAMKFGGLLACPYPVDFREANDSQAGKSLGHRCVVLVYNEEGFTITQKKGEWGLGSLEETFSAGLISGCPFLTFDNFRHHFDLPKFESAIKGQGTIDVRVFGRGSLRVPRNDCLFQMNSNGMTVTTDQANRLLIGKLVKQDRQHKFRRTDDELQAYIRENQEYLLQCVFTLIRDWWAKGKLRSEDSIDHAFPEFYTTFDWFAKDAGLDSILDNHHEDQFRMGSYAMQWLRELSKEAIKDQKEGYQFSARELARLPVGRPKTLNSDVVGALERYIGQIIEAQLRRTKDNLVVDGIRIERILVKDEEYREKTRFTFNTVKR